MMLLISTFGIAGLIGLIGGMFLAKKDAPVFPFLYLGILLVAVSGLTDSLGAAAYWVLLLLVWPGSVVCGKWWYGKKLTRT